MPLPLAEAKYPCRAQGHLILYRFVQFLMAVVLLIAAVYFLYTPGFYCYGVVVELQGGPI